MNAARNLEIPAQNLEILAAPQQGFASTIRFSHGKRSATTGTGTATDMSTLPLPLPEDDPGERLLVVQNSVFDVFGVQNSVRRPKLGLHAMSTTVHV